MRARPAYAATARALGLAIQPGCDRVRAAVQLAEVTPPRALQEALAVLRPSLFAEEDAVTRDAVAILALATLGPTARGLGPSALP
jgi:hypothetical protein